MLLTNAGTNSTRIMIYEIRKSREKTATQFFIFCQHAARHNLKKRCQKVPLPEKRRKRSPLSSPRERNVNYWSTTWGKLLASLSAIDGGPSITSREGKLFRRRFRVPWDVFCDLVKKALVASYLARTLTKSSTFPVDQSVQYPLKYSEYCEFLVEIGVATM